VEISATGDLTGDDLSDLLCDACQAAGIDAYVSKPVQVHELQEALELCDKTPSAVATS
jgi:CheY-like chemotaxis protein